jgi:hypothetical protein
LSSTSTSAARKSAHQRGLSGVGVAHQTHPALAAAARPAVTVVALHIGQLLAKLGDAVAHLAAVEFEGRLAGAAPTHAAALAILAAAHAGPQAGHHVAQPGDFHLQAGLAGLRVAVEDFDDHPRAVEHVGAGGLLEVARLAGVDLVVHHHHVGVGHGAFGEGGVLLVVGGVGLFFGLFGLGLVELGVVESFAGLGDSVHRRGGHLARAAGVAGQLVQLALAQHRAGLERLEALRDDAHHLVAQRLEQAAQLGDGTAVFGVFHIGQLHRHDDGGAQFGLGRGHG